MIANVMPAVGRLIVTFEDARTVLVRAATASSRRAHAQRALVDAILLQPVLKCKL